MPTVARNKLYLVAWLDPAGGTNLGAKNQYGRSRASIVVIGQDSIERIFILKAWAKRCPPDQLIHETFETQREFSPAAFGVDSSGPQLMFAQMLIREARERGIKHRFRPTPLRMDKTFSIETTLQPVVNQGRLFRPPEIDCSLLKGEWNTFPGGPYQDIMDALACAVRLLPASLPEHLQRMGQSQLRDYLRRTGMPEDQIKMKMIQHAEIAVAR